jgi:tetrapyrrole methylase family protein/MazG family protein
MAGITIVGLGPGEGSLLTRQAWQVISHAPVVYLRTARHPAVADLPPEVELRSFDEIYEQAEDFAQVYTRIADEVLRLGKEPEGIVYAVPGDPHIGESTVSRILAGAAAEGIAVSVISGMSFVEPVLRAVGMDGMAGLQLFDAIEVAGFFYPPINPNLPLVVGQVYSRLLAGDLKLTLMVVYPAEHEVRLVHGAGTPAEQVETMPLYALDHSRHIDHLTSLYMPGLPAAVSLPALAEAIAVLRSPEGCPWDQEQTSQSLREGFLEEVSEALAAIDQQDMVSLQEELGDVLLHIVMQAQIAHEEELFGLTDVIGGIYAKIKRRHPHVWGDWEASSAAEVIANWEALKAEERGDAGQQSLLDNIPSTLPALARSQKIQNRVKQVGFDWPAVSGVIAKVHEEIVELQATTGQDERFQELGDLLFAVVNWARWLDIDAESALREANLRFADRFRLVEGLAVEKGWDLSEVDLDTLEMMWQQAKQRVRESAPGEDAA